jgi:hypothetical protein
MVNVPQDTDAAALFALMARPKLGEGMWQQIVDEALACRSKKGATLLGVWGPTTMGRPLPTSTCGTS